MSNGSLANLNGQNDRVSFSFGMKLSLPTKYESADFHVSWTSDVNPMETIEQAFARVKSNVAAEAYRLYNQIRDSETGLLNEQSRKQEDVGVPAKVQEKQDLQAKAKDPKILRKQIKSAYDVLKAQKKITNENFVIDYLKGKKLADLKDSEVLDVIDKLKINFKELSL